MKIVKTNTGEIVHSLDLLIYKCSSCNELNIMGFWHQLDKIKKDDIHLIIEHKCAFCESLKYNTYIIEEINDPS